MVEVLVTLVWRIDGGHKGAILNFVVDSAIPTVSRPSRIEKDARKVGASQPGQALKANEQ